MKTKKSIFILFIAMLISSSSFANFVSAKIKVTGITCSMCSNSVNKALSSLKFVDKVEVDLEKAIFTVTFKQNEDVVIDEIKSKIEGAGFSVGELIADFKFSNISVTNDFHYQFQNNTYHFVNVKNQSLNDAVAIRFVDKGFTSQKEYKKYVSLTTSKCIKTGKAENCCHSDDKQRIYHITI
jgi:copper chaperone CopZ